MAVQLLFCRLLLLGFIEIITQYRFTVSSTNGQRRTDTATAWKNCSFISSKRKDFHVVVNLWIAIHALPMRMLISLSVDEILLPRYMNWFINFRGLPFNKKMTLSCLRHERRFIWVYIETNASFCLLQDMRQKFGLSRCIWKKHLIIYVVCISDSFRKVSYASCFFFFSVKPFSFTRIYFSVCAKKLILSFLLFIQCQYHGYINANIGLWWIRALLNFSHTSKHPNKTSWFPILKIWFDNIFYCIQS